MIEELNNASTIINRFFYEVLVILNNVKQDINDSHKEADNKLDYSCMSAVNSAISYMDTFHDILLRDIDNIMAKYNLMLEEEEKNGGQREAGVL